MRNHVTIVLILVTLLFVACEEEKQNFVFILVDDLGWTDLGYSGSTFYETPHIDRFSEQSIQFTNAYASGSVCSPSRASIMTGKHPARLKITDWIPGLRPDNRKLTGPSILNQLPLREVTLAEVLKEKGYATFFAGKWHLGDEGYFPEDQGFDVNHGGHDKGSPPGGYYTPYNNPKLDDGPEGEYLTDRLTNESIGFLDTIGDQPFFLYLSFYTVHTPIQANLKYIDKFEQKLDELGNPKVALTSEGDGTTRLDQNNPAYASMLYALDQNINRLLRKLKEAGLYENTTIIFTSDNGGLSTLDQRRKNPAPTSVLPLRGGKGWLYEGGIRIPLLIKPANYKGDVQLCNTPVIGHDFYPTILKMTGMEMKNADEIDGVDISPLFESEGSINRSELFWHYPHYHGSAWKPGAAIRQGDWKLIAFYETEIVELYNLANDISERNDLSLKYPEKTKELLLRLQELKKEINAEGVAENPDFVKTN